MTQYHPSIRFVVLYGVDHSPWVQGVRFALSYHGVPTRLTSIPLSLAWYLKNGLTFPAIKLMDGSIHTDSFKIYELLEERGVTLGVHQLSDIERESAQIRLETMFSNYALGRVMNGRQLSFLKAWSTMTEVPSSKVGIACRSLLSLYFWALINLGIYATQSNHRAAYDLEQFEQDISYWNDKLEHVSWLTGSRVGFLDFALLGHLQCMTSGLTDELIPIIQRQPHLMKWLDRLHDEFNGYNPLFTQRLINQHTIERANLKNRIIFWLALAVWLLILPITGFIILLGLYQRGNNPARTGGVISRKRSSDRLS